MLRHRCLFEVIFIKMDNKGQMLVLETIFFTATVILSLIFLYQLSPPSVVSNTYTDDLSLMGNDALYNLYRDDITDDTLAGYPASKLVNYLITNEVVELVENLNSRLPVSILYNVFISDGTDKIFWCNSFGESQEFNELPGIDPLTISSCIVAIDETFIAGSTDIYFRNGDDSRILLNFPGHDSCLYRVILELWYI